MPVLGIETSCDETALALVAGGRLLAAKLASQADAHALFGGVVPELASREHLRVIAPLYAALMAEAGLSARALSGIAVARGPGLLGCLLVGVSFAKGLALATGAPLMGVNHLHAHLLAPGLERPLTFPAVGLLISGGHTHLYRLGSPLDIELLGRTLDDAVGEAFDKVAKLLNLPYPGGRYVDLLAAEGQADPDLFPLPYVDNQNLDFSFSGLKTAVANLLARRPELRLPRLPWPPPAGLDELGLAPDQRAALAHILASFSHVAAKALRIKTRRAFERVAEARGLVVAGGVAANSCIRRTMAELAAELGVELALPSPGLCTDNAAMVAYAGELRLMAGRRHGLDLLAVPRGQRVPNDDETWAEARQGGTTPDTPVAADTRRLDTKPSAH